MVDENDSHIVAIGGLLPDDGSLALFQYLLDLTGKPEPAIGFIPTASGDAPESLHRIRDLCAKLRCRLSDLPLFDRTPDLEEYVAAQDLILVGGGNTKSMLAVWREWGLPDILQRAWRNGKILAGWSAGAICWFDEGVTDSYADRLRRLDCLGFLPGSCCPHYTAEAERRPAYHEFIRTNQMKAGIALDDGGAVHFRGTDPWRVVAPSGTLGARKVCADTGGIREEPLVLERIDL